MQSMNAKDAVSASLAECFVTIEGNRYNFMQAINLEASIEKTTVSYTHLDVYKRQRITCIRLMGSSITEPLLRWRKGPGQEPIWPGWMTGR